MGTPSARFVIEFGADTSGIDKATAKLGTLDNALAKETAAFKKMGEAMNNLKNTTAVMRWEGLPKDIAKAEDSVAKFAAKIAKMKADLAGASGTKKEGLLAGLAANEGELEKATKQLAGLRAEREKLAGNSKVKLFEDLKAGAAKLKESIGDTQTEISRFSARAPTTFFDKRYAEIGAAAKKIKSLLSAGVEKVKPFIGTDAELAAVAAGFKGLGAAAAVALPIVTALFAAMAVGTLKAVSFAVSMADAARDARLLREAATGSAEGAADLYDSLVRVEGKSSASRGTIAELANEYARLKFSMGAIEGATTAITIATQTMGQQVGSTIKGLIDRGMVAKRFWLNPLDLRGTGIAIHDVATQLGKSMKIGVGAAEYALRTGTVKIEDGVKAMAAAIEASPLGAIARKQALSLTTQFERAKDNIGRLFDGVKIEGFLEKLSGVLDLFKETSDTGKALKESIAGLFQPFIDAASDSLPDAEGMIWEIATAIQEMRIGILKAGGAKAIFKEITEDAKGLWDVLKGIATTAEWIGKGLNLLRHPIEGTKALIAQGQADQKAAEDAQFMRAFNGTLSADETKSMGISIDAGIAAGIKAGSGDPMGAMTSLAADLQKAFDLKIERHSPAKLFRRSGRDIPRGVEQGVEEGKPGVARALASLADPSDMNAKGAGATIAHNTRSEDRSVTNIFNFNGGERRSAMRFMQDAADALETITLAKGLRA